MAYRPSPFERLSAAAFLPSRLSLASLKRAAASCEGCELYRRATQTVFGEGSARAKIVFVGEQPGDVEDREGHPFVGPAGRLLDSMLQECGIDRDTVYVTNAVKHFKWEPRGKRRLHAKPSAREMAACRPWLDAELRVVKPKLVVCLGATAAQQLMGLKFRITRERGKVIAGPNALSILTTYHPSAVLRAPDDQRAKMREEVLADLKRAARYVGRRGSA
jgi:uracil-DNA glycosylase